MVSTATNRKQGIHDSVGRDGQEIRVGCFGAKLYFSLSVSLARGRIPLGMTIILTLPYKSTYASEFSYRSENSSSFTGCSCLLDSCRDGF